MARGYHMGGLMTIPTSDIILYDQGAYNTNYPMSNYLYGTGSISEGTSTINLYASIAYNASAGAGGDALKLTNRKIDLTPYKHIQADISYSISYTSFNNRTAYIGLYSSIPSSAFFYEHAVHKTGAATSTSIILDVESLTGEFYIGVGNYLKSTTNANPGANSTTTVSLLKLLKD